MADIMTNAAPNTKHSVSRSAHCKHNAKAGQKLLDTQSAPVGAGPFLCKGAQSLSASLCIPAFFWYKARPDLHSPAWIWCKSDYRGLVCGPTAPINGKNWETDW